jgi:hypothetical protein
MRKPFPFSLDEPIRQLPQSRALAGVAGDILWVAESIIDLIELDVSPLYRVVSPS